MTIAIANDHNGVELKQKVTEYLLSKGYNVNNYGTDTNERVDYPKYGIIVGEKVANKEADFGIVICGSAIGISIACNKVKGIRCGKVDSIDEAIHGRERDFVNVIALSGNGNIDENIKIVEAFLEAKENYEDPAYKMRVDQILEYEND